MMGERATKISESLKDDSMGIPIGIIVIPMTVVVGTFWYHPLSPVYMMIHMLLALVLAVAYVVSLRIVFGFVVILVIASAEVALERLAHVWAESRRVRSSITERRARLRYARKRRHLR